MRLYDVAYELKMTVAQVRSMEYTEFLGWLKYLDTAPIGWRDDLRAFKLMQTWGVKAKGGSVFRSLQIQEQNANTEANKLPSGYIPAEALKSSGIFAKLLSAKGGDNLELS